MSLLCRLKNLVHKGVLKEKDLERIVIVPKGQEPCDCISRQAVLDMVEDMTDQFGNKHRVVTEGMINLLPPVTPKPKTDVLDKIRAEITEDLSNAEKESKSTQDDIDCGICIGLQMAIDTINKRQGRK